MRPDPFDCRAAVDRLYDYLDGELSPADADRVRAHLEVCAHCFALFDFESAFLRFLEARRDAAGAPPTLRRHVLHRLLHEHDLDQA